MLTSNRRSGQPSPGSSGSPSHSSAQSSSTDGPQRLFNVSVVGLSGTERDKGSSGVGKSCLCNRFVRPLEDDFVTDHISTLSQADFGGSSVVNNDHWLYWGERTITVADDSSTHADWTFRLIEQTEFVDDESFQPLTGSGPHQKEAYYKRAAAVKLHSPDKLMYVRKDQLGLETEYEQRILTDGRVAIDGFIFVYDVSVVPRRSFQQQTDFAVHVLHQICKVAKKPVVLVAAKYDDASIDGVKEVERLLSRKELRGYSIPVVDCSSVVNINVEAAFSLLGHIIDKCKSKPKILSFKDAERSRREQCEVARSAFVHRLKMYIPLEEWPRRRVTWSMLMTRLGMSRDSDFVHFCELFGRGQAQKMYRQYVNELREVWMQRKLAAFAPRLPEAFRRLLPDGEAIRGCRWPDVLQMLQSHPLFDDYFQPLGTLGSDLDPISPDQDLSRPDDRRIPAELLLTPDAEICFANYANVVQAETKRERLQEEFEQLLAECTQVTPGKPMSDVRIFFLGKDCFESLADADAQDIYDRFQRHLVKRARQDFVELLLEHVDLFVQRIVFRARRQTPVVNNRPTLPGLSEVDMNEIRDILQEDIRYRQLNRLFEARDNMICQYASFVSYPLIQHCPAGNRCIDSLIDQILATHAHRAHIFDSGSESSSPPAFDKIQLNLVILGGFGLPDQLIREIRHCLPEDVYQGEKGGPVRLCYRVVEGDVRSTSNRLTPGDALAVVFSSRRSLEVARDALTHSLLFGATTSAADEQSSLRDLLPPAVVILACDPNHLDDLPFLQQQGALLSDSLQAPFIGVGSAPGTPSKISPRKNEADVVEGPTLFSREQIGRLLECASTASKVRKTSSLDEAIAAGPVDLRIELCLMCGDQFPPQAVLGPLLAEGRQQSINVNRGPITTIDPFLPRLGRRARIEIRIDAYHTAFLTRPKPQQAFDGYIFAYSARRRASLAHLNALAHTVVPPSKRGSSLLLVAVGEVTDFFNDHDTNALLTEGNELADKLRARFITVSPNADQQGGTYNAFFDELFDMKSRAPAPRPNDDSEYATLSEMRSGVWEGQNGSSPNTETSDGALPDDTSCRSVGSSPTKKVMCSQFARGTLSIPVGTASSSSSSFEPSGRRQSDLTGMRPKDKGRFGASETGSGGRLASLGEFAPLATPEHIEVGMEYMTVKDAIGGYSDDEQQYATLDSINRATTSSEAHSSASDTRHSSLEGRRACATDRSSSPSETGAPRQRDPATRPKAVSGCRPSGDAVGIADRLRRLNQDLLLTVPGADATRVEARSRTTGLLTSVSTGALMMRSASDESIVDRTPTPADGQRRKPKTKGQFVRRVTSSFRFRKNRRLTPSAPGDADWSESESAGSKSVPQSPLMERQLFAPLPAHQRAVFVLPPVAPNNFDDPVIDSARQTSPQQSSFSWLPTRSPKRDRSVPANGAEKKTTVLGGLRRASADHNKGKKSSTTTAPGTPSSGVVPNGATLFELAPTPNDPVPLFVRKCVEFIESEGGLELEGLYRVPGNQSQVAQLEQKFVENHALDFRSLDLPVNAVATALKNFFSALAEPVLPYALYNDLITAVGADDHKLPALRRVLDRLPSENRHVLRYLIAHMRHVADNAHLTAMDLRNLAKCWWPTLLRPHFDSFESMAGLTPRLEEFAQLLLQHSDLLLGGDIAGERSAKRE